MATRKLYYEDCHLRSFSACVTGCEQTGKGYAITLDATAFYPEGGGQACDLGTLGIANVLDVQEQGEEVIHLCDSPLEVGAEVTGRIDYERRFDLMQQHTGEHIVSGIVHRLYGFDNVGFHVGSEVLTVDFDGIIRELNQMGYHGPLCVEWEDSGMERMFGAKEAYEFVKRMNFEPSDVAFDAALKAE